MTQKFFGMDEPSNVVYQIGRNEWQFTINIRANLIGDVGIGRHS